MCAHLCERLHAGNADRPGRCQACVLQMGDGCCHERVPQRLQHSTSAQRGAPVTAGGPVAAGCTALSTNMLLSPPSPFVRDVMALRLRWTMGRRAASTISSALCRMPPLEYYTALLCMQAGVTIAPARSCLSVLGPSLWQLQALRMEAQ